MRKWMWAFPLLSLVVLAGGCSKDRTNDAAVITAPPTTAAPARPDERGAAATAAAREVPPAAPAISARVETESADRSAPVRTEIEIPRGTPLHVRLDQGLSTHANHAGDGFDATLTRPVMLHGGTVLPAGTRFQGHVTTADASGRLKGRAVIAVTLDAFRANGREHRVSTSRLSRVSEAHKKRNALLIGGGAGLGAAIGAIAGGGKGAAIGGLAGAGAGTAGAAATGKLHAAFPSEAGLTFTTTAPVRL